MATLYNYIPSYPMFLNVYGKNIKIDGISEFKVHVDNCIANYSVWVNTTEIEPLLPEGKKNTIICSPTEINEKGTLKFNDIEIECEISKISYIPRRHGYIVEIKGNINSKDLNRVKYISPEEKNNNKKINRFEIMDI